MRLSIVFAALCISCASPWGRRAAVYPDASWCPAETRLDVQRIAKGAKTLAISVVCLDEHDRPHGPLMTWDQKFKQIQTLGFADHGVLKGPNLAWYPNGQLWQSFAFVNGKADGQLTMWHPTGEVQVRAFWRAGELDGVWEQYDKSGHLRRLTRFANGKVVRDGVSRTSADAQPTP